MSRICPLCDGRGTRLVKQVPIGPVTSTGLLLAIDAIEVKP